MAVAVRPYDDLRLRLERGDGGRYRVLASARSGEASGSFELPFGDLEIENFVLRASRGGQRRRRMESAQTEQAREFGARLFDALFRERVRDVYHEALTDADRTGHGLRITLSLTGTPELMDLPWEFLYDEPNFLAISVMTPVVRYLDLPRPRRPLAIEPPLRILGMVSSPDDAAPLDVERERANLEHALGGLIDAGHVDLRWLPAPTLSALLHELRTEAYHVFHYVGHGMYDPDARDGVLLLEDEGGRGRPVSGTELGTILRDCTSLRLAVLNACEGARVARDDPFAGVAAALVQREIPAVIAMQFEITDQAAIVFAEGFYEAIAAGFPVDAALAEARKSIFADHNDIEWGTPVLFMRVADGRIFDVPSKSAPARRPRIAVDLSVTPAVVDAGERATWRLAVQNLGRSPLSSLTALDGEGRQVCGPLELAPGATHELSWTSTATTDTDQTVTVGGQTARGGLVSDQASAHLTVRRPSPSPAPAPPAPPGPEERAATRPPRRRHWHVNAGVLTGEALAALGGVALVAAAGNTRLADRLTLSNVQPDARGRLVLALIACAVIVRVVAWLAARGSAIGVAASLAEAAALLIAGVLAATAIADDGGALTTPFDAFDTGDWVAFGGAVAVCAGGLVALLSAIAALASGMRDAPDR